MNKKTLLALSIGALFSHSVMAETISGIIVDKAGKPVSKAKIEVNGSKLVVYADADGRFTLSGIRPGNVELHVTAKNYSHYNKSYDLPQSGLEGLNIILSPTVFDVIKVNATPLHSSTIESALPVNVIAADALRMKQASSLGETLKNEVGVHSTFYGPSSSSPVIRGLDGPRVMVTQNGLDAGDASRVGPDHAVSSESSTANQIEVLRGPATLFYGSGAIGGVVNVIDNRVPHTRDTTFEWLAEYNSVASERLASINANTAVDQVALHFDGFWRDSGDYKLAGPAELESDEEHQDHEEHHEPSRLPNSSSKASGYTAGSSYMLDNGFVGFSIGRIDRTYDVPGHAAHSDEHEEDAQEPEETVYADMRQNRYQMITKLDFDDSYFSAAHGKMAYTDYQHMEIEDGAIGTTFKNKSLEGRVELYHREHNGYAGALSLHYKRSDFTALGEEAFTPPSESEFFALSLLEEKHFGDWVLQLGGRLERSILSADGIELDLGAHEEQDDHEDGLSDIHFDKQTFNPLSLSAGLIWNFSEGYNFALSAAYSQRAPSASELFSFGPHIGTRSFEVGALFDLHQEADGDYHVELSDQALDMETSYNLDFTLRKFDGDVGFVFNVFYNNVDDFFYQRSTGLFVEGGHAHSDSEDAPTGEEDHGAELPMLIFDQQDAKLYGFEAQVIYQLNSQVKLTAFSDYIRGKLDGGENLPRIPPMRVGGKFNYSADNYGAELSVTHYTEQDEIGYLETSTDGYTMLDMNFNYYFNTEMGDLTLYLKGHNLTDEHARVHSSFLKNSVPLPGRGFSLGIRGGF